MGARVLGTRKLRRIRNEYENLPVRMRMTPADEFERVTSPYWESRKMLPESKHRANHRIVNGVLVKAGEFKTT